MKSYESSSEVSAAFPLTALLGSYKEGPMATFTSSDISGGPSHKDVVQDMTRNNTIVFKLIYFHCTLSVSLSLTHTHKHTHSLLKDLQSFTKPLNTYKIVHCLRHTRINIYKSFQKKMYTSDNWHIQETGFVTTLHVFLFVKQTVKTGTFRKYSVNK